jgi:hypothetical protein
MFETFLARVTSVFHAIPFSGATWFVLLTLTFFLWLFARASANPLSPVKWEHLILDTSTERASPYKMGYLVGMIVGTWIVLTFADKDKLNFDIFGMYLTYLLGGASWNSFVKSKGDPAAVMKAAAAADETPKP